MIKSSMRGDRGMHLGLGLVRLGMHCALETSVQGGIVHSAALVG